MRRERGPRYRRSRRLSGMTSCVSICVRIMSKRSVRNRYDTHVRVDRAERIVCRVCACLRESVEDGRFAHVGKPNNSCGYTHCFPILVDTGDLDSDSSSSVGSVAHRQWRDGCVVGSRRCAAASPPSRLLALAPLTARPFTYGRFLLGNPCFERDFPAMSSNSESGAKFVRASPGVARRFRGPKWTR